MVGPSAYQIFVLAGVGVSLLMWWRLAARDRRLAGVYLVTPETHNDNSSFSFVSHVLRGIPVLS